MKRKLALRRVLYIGNSYTSRNDLPELIAKLAAAAGQPMEQEMITAGGAALRRHWNAGQSRLAIERGGWDYVVLQEQSTLPIKNPGRMRENVLLFDGVIKASGAKTALYMTWARQKAPQTQDAINQAYESVGREIGAILIPVGVAWQRFRRKHREPELYDGDGSHPTLAGSWLAACVAFRAFFPGATLPRGFSFDGLDSKVSDLMRSDVLELA